MLLGQRVANSNTHTRAHSHTHLIYILCPNYGLKIIKINTGFIRIKTFCSTKELVKRIKRQAKDWEKIFENHISDKGLISRIYDALSKLNINLFGKWAKDTKRHFTEDGI